jgi:16S rRNA (uracil1498-N3)-methyltransferase
MNLLLLQSSQINGNQATVSGRQFAHLNSVHQADQGSSVRVGEVNGLMGNGIIRSINDERAVLDITLNTPPPPPIPLTLILAMPRPKMLRRTLQSISSLGVKKIYLINSARVEKSFWQTPFLSDEALHNELALGLEQARDTVMPTIYQRKLFKPFVEDELSDIISDGQAFVAHPSGTEHCPIDIKTPSTLVIGPEGGFVSYEIEKLAQVGVEAVTIGPRILRVETAVPALISRLFPG